MPCAQGGRSYVVGVLITRRVGGVRARSKGRLEEERRLLFEGRRRECRVSASAPRAQAVGQGRRRITRSIRVIMDLDTWAAS
jgi:hypothetical protein